MFKNFLPVACCFVILGCSSPSTPDASNENEGADTTLTGVFLDSAVEGVSYSTETISSVTNASGEFQYIDGESVTFSIGDLAFPTTPASEVVTPLDMTSSGSIYDNIVVNTIVLLQSLDTDADASNGITISEQAKTNASAVDLSVSPSDFSQTTDVINLIANSGSIDTNLVSEDAASQHFQSTLVSTGALEEFTRMDYTNFITGNTADFSSGSKIYYRDDGTKFALLLNGNRFEGTWWLDENGLICEDIPSSQTAFCVADALNFMFNKSPNSTNFYNYSETGFVSGLTITEGDTLGLSGT